MFEVVAAGSIAALLALGSAVALLAWGGRKRDQETIAARVRELLPRESAPTAAPARRNRLHAWMRLHLARADIQPTRRHAWALGAGGSLLALLGLAWHGPVGAIALVLLGAGGVHVGVLWRGIRRKEMMLDQLPAFVEHIARSLDIGNTVEAALASATAESMQPLRSVAERVLRQVRLGGTLDEALEAAAELHQLRELRIFTLAVRVSRRYGSSIQGMLKSLVLMIRQQDTARRELKALTGETRLSAWVLGLLPAGMAGYIVLTTPDYLATMWGDASGRAVLIGALLLQAAGVLVLWRMLRSM